MSKIQIVKRANRKVSSCDPADPGVLGLLDSKIVFSPDNPTSPRKLVVEIRDIKCLINNEKGPAWLGFTSYKDGKICLEFPSFSDLLDFRKLVDNALAAGFGEAAEATSAAQSTSESSVFSHGAIATAAELQRSVDDLRQRGEPYRKLEEAMRYAVVER
ncbi:hypothetical protein M0R45_028107 [Rubus argutus]|uniref:Uncharacterized protein n=1 Tax=Rubus argutus TaxID=59490 RepID=A0AAW1W3Q8_RUBAR